MKSESRFTVLVVAKAPQPGRVKTRLCPPLSHEQAAELAGLALLDTLSAAAEAVGGVRDRVVVALDGDPGDGVAVDDVRQALQGCVVVPQRGGSFAERLVNAHGDAAAVHVGSVVLQIGMDTPQVGAEQLVRASRRLHCAGAQAVLGPATDGGWWLLGLSDPSLATALHGVPMSTDLTGQSTYEALISRGCGVAPTESMQDVDTWDDARTVAQLCPTSRFAGAVRGLATELVGAASL